MQVARLKSIVPVNPDAHVPMSSDAHVNFILWNTKQKLKQKVKTKIPIKR
jgi:hypothetical protein